MNYTKNSSIIILHLLFTNNNIFFTGMDIKKKLVFKKTMGIIRSKGVKKTNITSLKLILGIFSKFLENKNVYVQMKGYNKFKRIILKLLLQIPKTKITSFCDTTNLPFNGCRNPKSRRI